jgi:hypothetical protein
MLRTDGPESRSSKSKVNIGCQNGNNGTRMNHSRAEVTIAHGTATMASETAPSLAVHLPSTPKNTSAQLISAHW